MRGSEEQPWECSPTGVRPSERETDARPVELLNSVASLPLDETPDQLQHLLLGTSPEFCRAILASVDVGVTLIDTAFNIVAANRKHAEIIDRKFKDVIGNKCYWANERRDSPCDDCPGVRAMAEQRSVEKEVVARKDDGQPIAVHLRASPLFDRKGGIIGFVEVVEDVSKRNAYESEIERLNRLYAALSELNRTCARTRSREELFETVCRIATEKAGFKTAWIGVPDRETQLVRPLKAAGDCADFVMSVQVRIDDSPMGRGPMGTCLRNGETAVFNEVSHSPNADTWRGLASERGCRAAAGLPIFFRGAVYGGLAVYDTEQNVFRDKEVALLEEFAAAISMALESMDREEQRKKAEEWGKLEKARLEFLYHLCRATDRDDTRLIQVATENAVQLTGSQIGFFATLNDDESATAVQYCSQGVSEGRLLHDKPLVYSLQESGLWGEVVRQRGPVVINNYDAEPLKKDFPVGHLPIVRQMSVPVFENGHIVAMASVANKSADYTEDDVRIMTLFVDGMWHILCRKRSAERLQQYAADLEKANRALEEANLAAEAANRAKSEFLANMSHEIRTPVTAILGFSELLNPTVLPTSERRKYLKGIQRNGQTLLERINTILELSRLDIERQSMEKGECIIRQLVDDVVAQMTPEARKKKLRISVREENVCPKIILTDVARLRQILVTLVGNAVKFTEHGEIRVTMHSMCQEGRSPKMVFSVTDTGIGIPLEKIPELFHPFTQADGSAARRYGGAGVGLALSGRLAKTLGGSLGVMSAPGMGSTFTLTIHAETPQNAEIRQPTTPHEPRIAPLPRLLLAEDDVDIQTITRLLLRKLKLDVAIAPDGEAACKMAQQSIAENRPYDLIFMDIQMPRMNGHDATRWLRQHGWQGRIVALTAHALAGDREKCLAAGCDDYLAKPMFLDGLREVLERHLGYRPPAREATTPPNIEAQSSNLAKSEAFGIW